MSGKASGWVGEHGPHPDHIHLAGDHQGEPYGSRARGLRFILLAVADAADVDGRHAHPGVNNVARFTLYNPSSCRRLLTELEAEGWLVCTHRSNGRGDANVYDLVMDPDRHPTVADGTRSSCAPSSAQMARMADPESRASPPVSRASHPESRASDEPPTVTNGSPTGTQPTPPPSGDGGRPPSSSARGSKVTGAGRAVATEVWERSGDVKPATPFIGVAQIADRLLAAGHDHDAVVGAMLEVPTISVRWVEARLNERRPTARSTARAARPDRDTPSGRLDL